eukprot:768552-Hanusia_phi.AAC.2
MSKKNSISSRGKGVIAKFGDQKGDAFHERVQGLKEKQAMLERDNAYEALMRARDDVSCVR